MVTQKLGCSGQILVGLSTHETSANRRPLRQRSARFELSGNPTYQDFRILAVLVRRESLINKMKAFARQNLTIRVWPFGAATRNSFMFLVGKGARQGPLLIGLKMNTAQCKGANS